MKKLVVTNPFGGHEIGAEITDPQRVNDILANEHAHHVVQVAHNPVADIYHPDELAKHEAKVTQPAETKEA